MGLIHRSAPALVATTAVALGSTPTAQRAAQPVASPPGAATDDQTPARAFDRLVDATKKYAAICDQITRTHGRKEPPRLMVAFGWVMATEADKWPTGFAPRADFIKLADLALAEADRQGVLKEIAAIARLPAIAYPARGPSDDSTAFTKPTLDLFRVHRYLADRAIAAGDWPGAADHLVTLLGLSRLLTDVSDPIVAMTGSEDIGLGVAAAMPAIVDHRMPAAARRTLARGLAMPLLRPDRITSDIEFWKANAVRCWKSLPDDLFADADRAARAFNKLDEKLAVEALTLAYGPGNAPQFPFPHIGEITADIDTAAKLLREWRQPPATLQALSDARRAAARTPSERRVAYVLWISVITLQTTDRLALSHDALRTAIALEDFRERTGDYPDSLAALVPDLLTELPVDPFSTGEPLVYRRGQVTIRGRAYPYILYSRGGDGVDNGGTPSPDASVWLQQGAKDVDIILNAVR